MRPQLRTAVRRVSLSTRVVAIGCVLLVVSACSGQPSAAQLEWCALNQAEVGRSALELGIFDEAISFSDWKQSDPDAYDRACLHAFERASG